MSAIYTAVRVVLRAAVRVFYGEVEVTGSEHMPASGPTIIACNHPNSIVDPLLLGVITDRPIAFCARDGLFKVPGFGRVLRAVGAIPIRRRTDHGGTTVDNAAAFAACGQVLAAGGVLAIFPEGKTHGHLRVEPIKTGVARIAVETGAQLGVRIVPVGITYLVRHAFRSDIHVAFGPPIAVPADTVGAVQVLTLRIGEALRELAVHIERTEDERFIAQVTAIIVGIRSEGGLDVGGQSPAERTALVRRVLDAYRWLAEVDPPRTLELRARIEHYMEEREALGLGGEKPALQHRGERRLPLHGPARVAFMTLGAPLALFGLVTSLGPHVLLRLAMIGLRLSTDRVAFFKLVGGAVIFAAAYALETYVVARWIGAAEAALFAALLVPAALFARRYLVETRAHRLQLRSLGAWWSRGRLGRLRAARQTLTAELSELRDRYLEHLARRSES